MCVWWEHLGLWSEDSSQINGKKHTRKALSALKSLCSLSFGVSNNREWDGKSHWNQHNLCVQVHLN